MNTVLIVLALLLYAAVDLALANCYVCKTVAQGAEFDLEDDKDMRNFVTDQCSYHEVLYYTYEMISLCQQIAPRIVSSPDILQMLRKPGKQYETACRQLGYCRRTGNDTIQSFQL